MLTDIHYAWLIWSVLLLVIWLARILCYAQRKVKGNVVREFGDIATGLTEPLFAPNTGVRPHFSISTS